MLTLTEAAGARLAKFLKDERAGKDSAMRLVIRGKKMELRLDERTPGDKFLSHKGKMVLLLAGYDSLQSGQ